MVGIMFTIIGDLLGFRRTDARNGLCCIMVLSALLLLVAVVEPAAAQQGGIKRVPAGGAPPPGSGPFTITGPVRAIDGDTIEVNIDGSRVGVRLIGIDDPRLNTSCGKVAASQLQAVVGEGLRLEEDPNLTFDERDLRLYYALEPSSGNSIAKKLVEAGVVRASGQGKEAQQLRQSEEKAKAEKKGCLWGGGAGGTGNSPQAGAATQQEEEATLSPVALLTYALERSLVSLAAAVGWIVPDSLQDYLAASPAQAQTSSSGFSEEYVASGLFQPTAFAFLPDGRILIAEKRGVVRVYKDGQLLSTPFIDISNQVNNYWDRGLIDVAVDANFATNGYVYLLFTYENDPTQLEGSKTARLIRVTASGDTAVPGSEVVLLGKQVGASCKDFPAGADCLPSDYYSHSVGSVEMAPDGSLFVSAGEAANFNTVDEYALKAQDLDSLGGKVLHITRSGQGLSTNPFYNGDVNANRSKVWAYGLRNPYRLNLKPNTNTPYLGDVGWGAWEEIDVATRGANFGWPCYEGNARQSGYEPFAVCQDLYQKGASSVKAPLIEWNHNGLGAAATGGAFYTGSTYPAEYQGKYFYGDYALLWMRSVGVDSNDQPTGAPTDFLTNDYTVDIEMGPDGNLYYLSIWSGELKRVVYGGSGGGGGGGGGGDTNQAPTATISAPSSSLKWKVGDVIQFSGSATDPEDGAIPDSNLRWDVIIHHCPGGACHNHQLTSKTGSSGSFTAPDHGDENYFELVLTATDSAGKTNTSRVEIHPQESQVTLATNPSGLQVVLDGTQGTAPLTRSLIVGSKHTIYAPSPQNNREFGSWSDGGAQQHQMTVGTQDTTYNAAFPNCVKGQFLAQYYKGTSLGGTPVAERCEASIAHQWGDAAPVAGTGIDHFSARWSGIHDFEAGTYTFEGASDDGIRVWIDGEQIIDEWRSQALTEFSATKTLTAGEHRVEVEYFDEWGYAASTLSWRMITAADTTAPETTLDSGPSGTVNSASASFSFSSSEQGSTFECSLDSGAFESCTSPQQYAGLADGSHTFKVKATDAAGNTDTTTPDSRTWTIDVTAPVAQPPAQDLTVGSALSTSTVPIELTWSATDGGTGVAGYQLQRSVGGAAYADVALPSATATTITASLDPGKTYRYQVRAQDKAGNWSTWNAGPSFAVDLRQEDNPAVGYTGKWTREALSTASGGYAKYAIASGAKARFSFTGSNVAWVAPMGTNKGKAEVWIDGVKVATVDLYVSTTQERKVVFTKSWSTSGSHTLEVRATGTKTAASGGKRVDVDAFVALR